MDTEYVYVYKTISDDPDSNHWLEEFRGVYRSEGPAVRDARVWMNEQLEEFDGDPDVFVKEYVSETGDKFILTLYDDNDDWLHKAVITREALK